MRPGVDRVASGRGEDSWRDEERDISLPAHAKIISPGSAGEAACIAD